MLMLVVGGLQLVPQVLYNGQDLHDSLLEAGRVSRFEQVPATVFGCLAFIH
jgi:hypothetical protein